MHRRVLTQLPLSVALILALMLPMATVTPAQGQTAGGSTARITIDSPMEGATITMGVETDIGGWAVDPAGAGTGVDMVRVYIDNPQESANYLGTATYGKPRFDVAAALGNPAFAAGGFDFVWTPTGISTGQHTLYVYARSASGWSFKTVNVTLRAAPMIPAPAPDPYRAYHDPFGWPYSGYDADYGMWGPMYPYPQYPPYTGYPGSGWTPPGRVCIMIYPPPPGC